MSDVKHEHLSGIQFDWVVVRELRFVDNPDRSEHKPPKGMEAEISVQATVQENGSACNTTLRLILRPPTAEPEQFEVIAATVEGRFSVSSADGDVSVPMEAFAEQQAPAILMPFLRQAIATATSTSRFGQVLVPPLNVSAIMAERKKQAAEAEQ